MRFHIQGKWRRPRFQQLQWKLMRSYMVVTVSAVLSINLLVWALVGYISLRPSLSPQDLTKSAREIAVQLSQPLSVSSPNQAEILQALHPLLTYGMSVDVANRDGKILACVPEQSARVGTSLFSQAPPEVKTLARAALAGQGSPSRLSIMDADGNSVAVVPVLGQKQQVRGLLFIKASAMTNLRDYSISLIGPLLLTIVLVGFFAAVVGLGFGFINARQLTRRLKVIADAADDWSRGEFATVARDDSADELGQLARRLNLMANELRELVVLRQNLATSEERNRLSRELHDTVKQQVFATTMQVGAARILLDRDIDQARTRLIEVESLASAAQRELTGILEQLRPGSYVSPRQSSEEIGSSLRDYVRHWSSQSGIAADVVAEPIANLSEDTRHGLFRITQEALTNVSRHSLATAVTVQLKTIADDVKQPVGAPVSSRVIQLVIEDTGRGFDPLHTDGGFGLQSMRERAQALPEGTFVLKSRVGHGTCVEVTCRAT